LPKNKQEEKKNAQVMRKRIRGGEKSDGEEKKNSRVMEEIIQGN
jgi:hypothetical protein